MFYLCRNPQTLETLKKEIRSTFANKEQIVGGKELSDCRYLKACIDEAMRLAPPVPGLLPREVTAKEGIEIDGVYIPEGVRALLLSPLLFQKARKLTVEKNK